MLILVSPKSTTHCRGNLLSKGQDQAWGICVPGTWNTGMVGFTECGMHEDL